MMVWTKAPMTGWRAFDQALLNDLYVFAESMTDLPTQQNWSSVGLSGR